MSTAIAAVLRFYKGSISIQDIRSMTPDQFNGYIKEIETIAGLESGEVMPSKEMIEKVKQDAAIRKPDGTR